MVGKDQEIVPVLLINGASMIGLSGDIGVISVTLSGGKMKALVRLKPGWKAYPGLRFGKNTRRIRPPKAVKATDVKDLLERNYNAKTRTLANLKITFMKDVGDQAGSYDVAVDVIASEQDKARRTASLSGISKSPASNKNRAKRRGELNRRTR